MSVPLAIVLCVATGCLTLAAVIVTGIRGWVETVRIRQGETPASGDTRRR